MKERQGIRASRYLPASASGRACLLRPSAGAAGRCCPRCARPPPGASGCPPLHRISQSSSKRGFQLLSKWASSLLPSTIKTNQQPAREQLHHYRPARSTTRLHPPLPMELKNKQQNISWHKYNPPARSATSSSSATVRARSAAACAACEDLWQAGGRAGPRVHEATVTVGSRISIQHCLPTLEDTHGAPTTRLHLSRSSWSGHPLGHAAAPSKPAPKLHITKAPSHPCAKPALAESTH